MNKKKLFSDYLFNLLRMMMNIGIPIITLPFVLRRIGAENYGAFSYTNSIITYFTMAAVMGIPDYGARSIAKLNKKNDIIQTSSEIFTIQMASVSLSLFIFYTVFYPLAAEEYKKTFLVLSIIIISNLMNIEWFYIGTQRFKFMSLRATIFKVGNALAMILLIKPGDQAEKYALIIALTSLGNGLVNLTGFIPFLRFKELKLRKHIKPILILFGLSITSIINGNIDKTLTGYLAGPLYVGYYAVGFRLTRIVQQIFTSLNHIIFPRITSYLAQNDEKQTEKLIRFNMDYILLLSSPILLGLSLYAERIIILLFEKELQPATGSFIILTGTVPVIAILNVIRRHILLPRDKEKVLIVLSLVTTAVNVVGNVAFVPQYKHIAAAAVTLAAEGMGMFYGLYYIRKKFNIHLFHPGQLKYLFSTLILFLPYYLGYLLSPYVANLILLLLQISLSIVLYFATLYLIKDDFFYHYTKRFGSNLLKRG
ncbi:MULTISPECIES: oligosaccharide flippase family protein [unclassified Oceanispirochaeta]|uniref:oligosaccharide flippase family protein n=1 Tax=unclassified Oceanispirochaeta TaxID=2635722 RepID=UPI000E0920A2|nr:MULTISPECIES: oligosaccharide flippase family protein [unclassified Oceanispirochaeta]MBF9017767.1 polysaccharide biosynthesis protein [Oceanispirochaeta sp. M2]NPD74331.1 polysaccharide biosynthesis protein [Oceanispirochaeta sp. M1]RDG29811.1 hypothetical protein DV872_19710 [Oceanispirochaeta sp. M1]